MHPDEMPVTTFDDGAPEVGSFEQELEALINKHSVENDSNTPDFILRAFMVNCLNAFNGATRRREEWCGGRDREPSALVGPDPRES